ncbi:hypothetical protein PB2503_06542 [Parvularcula bermudensis HTCC2503]|uniref:Uncharacterized protein n=1 Tax=Parvularcula bermudensis (strain ATCC BAA-594 / HTCC2503 / KCTC 12087) TaxID=314260 RepID=E0TI35_PARBH|nr:hypothetical protein [Parvularcula bermudensis]ADM09374.1 hypothetical protein PB2503_06542 [Parvularcula bermudensis HTCC2503]
MDQTFLSYALTDIRFSFASMTAIALRLCVPLAATIAFLVAVDAQAGGLLAALGATLLWLLAEWSVLLCRMARRLALGQEWPERLLAMNLFAMIRHLLRAYY